MTTTETERALLDEGMLQRFDERAPEYDRDNAFFTEDFEELRASGYFLATVPKELGGGRVEPGRDQRACNGASPTWRRRPPSPSTCTTTSSGCAPTSTGPAIRPATGCCARPPRATSSPPGTASRATTSRCCCRRRRPERVDGGWEFTGHKIFGSLSPVWTYLGIHGMDTSDPANPKVVHGFLHRDSPGYRIEPTWDTMGMRATTSNDTILDRAFVPDEAIVMVSPAGFGGAGMYHVALFAWALLGFAGVYSSIARRAFDDTVALMHQRTSMTLTRSMAYHPEVQHQIAEMRIHLEGMTAHLDRVCADWVTGVDHGMDWPAKIVACKYDVVTRAWAVVDAALDLTGGSGIFRRSRFEQLFRDARLGRIHPGNSMLTHELVGKLSLGINPDEQPRWG